MRQSGIRIMGRLIGLVKPLAGWMVLAVTLGVLGYLSAIALTILAVQALLDLAGMPLFLSFSQAAGLLLACAAVRGLLRYGEQACNHYIAFRLLAVLRHEIFIKLRQLAPAKLETQDKGNLISLITSDIELLEVFYAHTLSPMAIGTITSLILCLFLYQLHPLFALIGALGYLCVGALIPLRYGKRGADTGMAVRKGTGELNSFFLDSLRGIRGLMQFDPQQRRLEQFQQKTEDLETLNLKLKRLEGGNRAVTDAAVMIFSLVLLVSGLVLSQAGMISTAAALTGAVALFGSFGPVVALSSLSNNLHHTLASGQRLLDLLDETEQVRDITDQPAAAFGKVQGQNVSFAYDQEKILDQLSFSLAEGTVLGIHGRSGSGKSTLIRLLMRFWKPDQGTLTIQGRELETINTADLRSMESYVTQETVLFNQSLLDNIALARPDATLDEVREAARKAAIDDFIKSLPQGYHTRAGELGDHLSGGERQRIGLARAFLHDSDLMLLDEPTSNLDSLNEAIILKALKEEANGKTVLLVSHRRSTLAIADSILSMDSGRNS